MKVEGYDYEVRQIVDVEIEPVLAWTKGEDRYTADVPGYEINKFQGWNVWTPSGKFVGSMPTLRLAKIAAELDVRGIDPETHTPGDIRARVIGGGWGGWSRVYGAKANCRCCGEIVGGGTAAEARRDAWEHFETEAAKSFAAVKEMA